MNALIFLIPLALVMGATFVGLFFWAVRSGQYDDLDDPPERVLHDQ